MKNEYRKRRTARWFLRFRMLLFRNGFDPGANVPALSQMSQAHYMGGSRQASGRVSLKKPPW